MTQNVRQKHIGGLPLSGLYVILDPSVSPDRPLLEILKTSVQAGAKLFQYRNKTASMKVAYEVALALRKIAHELGALFIVNDRCDLALAVDADGVHLGQGDLPLHLARTVMGPNKLIGLSTHNVEQVAAGSTVGADYLGFGPIFTPGSKTDHDPVVGTAGLKAIHELTRLPIFAIGGITLNNVEDVIRAGANGVAVISAVLRASDIAQVVNDFVLRFSTPTAPTS